MDRIDKVGQFVELSQHTQNASFNALLVRLTAKSGIQPNPVRCVDENERDDILIPDKLMDRIGGGLGIGTTNVDHRDQRLSLGIGSPPKRVDPFEVTWLAGCLPKDMSKLGRGT